MGFPVPQPHGRPAGLPTGPGPVAAPAATRRRRSALTVITSVVLGLGALLLAALVFLNGGPLGGAITVVLAGVSFPLMILLCFWLDRYEPEPLRYRLAALGWGGIVAVIIGAGLSLLLAAIFGTPEAVNVAVWAPVTEEFGKGLFLIVVVLLRRHQMHGLLDGIVYGALVGIGFAFVEDILYYQAALAEGGAAGLTATFFLRGVITPFAHPLFTAATGAGVGIAVMSRSAGVKVLAPVGGYLVAVLLHGLWNGSSLFGNQAFFAVYGLVMLPLLVLVIVVGVWARRQEGRMLTSTLGECAQLGLIDPGEIRWVATMGDRLRARRHARQVGGKLAGRLVEDYQQTLTEMGFLHHRVRIGSAPADAGPRMQALLQRAAVLRPQLALPPPTPPAGLPGPYAGPPPPGTGWNPIPPGS